MRNILLVRPVSARPTADVSPPMGLMYLSSYLKKNSRYDYYVKLFDMRFAGNSETSLYALVRSLKPIAVGISVCSEEDPMLHKIADNIKKISQDVKIIVGGPHPTMYYREVLEDTNIDIAVIGEGEKVFCDILDRLDSEGNCNSVAGVAFRSTGGIVYNDNDTLIEDLDSIPFPDWDIIEFDRYSDVYTPNMNEILAGRKYMGIITSRGCPFNCVYCHGIFGRKFRARSPQNVVDEIKILQTKYNVDELHIYDDIFNLDRDRLIRISELIVDAAIKVKIAFPNGIRGDMLDRDSIDHLKSAGVYMITFALETASPRLQKLIRKNLDIEKLIDNIAYADKKGLLTKCFFMLGFPSETYSEIMETIDFACNSPLCFAGFFVVTPQRETELYKMITDEHPDYKHAPFRLNHYYSEDKIYEQIQGQPLRALQLYALRRFYLNPKRIFKLFIKIPNKPRVVLGLKRYVSFFLQGKGKPYSE